MKSDLTRLKWNAMYLPDMLCSKDEGTFIV